MDKLRSLDKIHLTEKQYLCFSKVAEHPKYAGKGFVEDASFAYPTWQQLIENADTHPYFVWPTINGWLGALNQGLKELKCPEARQLYSEIHKAYEYCQSVHEAQQMCRLQRRHDSIRVMCFIYFISLGEGLFKVSLNPPVGKSSTDLNLSHVWHRWSSSAKELNTMSNKRDDVFQSKVKRLAMEAEQVNRVGLAWQTQLPSEDHLIESIPSDGEGEGSCTVSVLSVCFVLAVISTDNHLQLFQVPP